MKSISEKKIHEIMIQKSRFITILIPVFSKQEIFLYLKNLKSEYKDATHYCYAYIIGNEMHCSDDGEPKNTAGLPMLQVLEKLELNYILCVVIRYFGGILLGAGGLVRAYTSSVTKAISATSLIDYKFGYEFHVTCSLEDYKKIDFFMRKNAKYTIEFQEIVHFIGTIFEEEYNQLLHDYDSIITIVKNNKTWLYHKNSI